MKHKQAVILLGGKGTRIQSLYSDRPKALVPVCGRPILAWQVDWLKAHGFTHVHLAAGYMADALQQWRRQQAYEEITISLSTEPGPLGTGGAIKFIEPWLVSDSVTVLNGDSLTPNLDFKAMDSQAQNMLGVMHQARPDDTEVMQSCLPPLSQLEHDFPNITVLTGSCREQWHNLLAEHIHAPLIVMAITPIEEAGRYGTVEFDKHHKLTSFREKADHQAGWINAGIYRMHRDLFSLIPKHVPFSLEQNLFPALASLGKVYVYPARPPLLDMGTPEGLAQMENMIHHKAE